MSKSKQLKRFNNKSDCNIGIRNLTKSSNNEIKKINNSIEEKLLAIGEEYEIMNNIANCSYQNLCILNTKLMNLEYSCDSDYHNNYLLNKYKEDLAKIKSNYINVKNERLHNNFLNIKSSITNDLRKIKYLESYVKQFDNKASLQSGRLNMLRGFNTANDFVDYLDNEFTENYENRIIDMELYIMQQTIPSIESKFIINNNKNNIINIAKTNAIKNYIPLEFKNKKMTYNKIKRLANDNNFFFVRSNGSHHIYKNIYDDRIVTIPNKGNKTIPPGTQNSILNQIYTPIKTTITYE